jgi:hypothetical protein
MNQAGLDLQIGHVLGMFAVVEMLVEALVAETSSPAELAITSAQHGSPLNGRSMRLRIESLLI